MGHSLLRLWLLLVVFFPLPVIAQAQSVESESVLVDAGYQWAIDPSGKSKLSDVLQADLQWQQESNWVVNHGFLSKSLWLRLSFESRNAGSKKKYLEIQSPFVDEFDVYLIYKDTGEVISLQLGGDHRKKSSYLNHRFPLFPLGFEQTGDYELYVRVSSTSALRFPFKISNPEYFTQAEMNRRIAYGICFGMLIVIALYNAIVWVFVGERSSLYNAAFIISAALYQANISGFGNLYLWNGNAAINDRMLLVLTSTSMYFGGRFAGRFLELRKVSWFLDKALLGVVIIFAVSLIPAIFLPESYVLTALLGFELTVFFVSLLIMIGLCFAGHYWARYLLAGWSVLMCGVGVLVASFLGLLDASVHWDYVHATGLALGNVLVTSALAAGLRKTRIDKDQAMKEAISLAQEVSELNREKEKLTHTVNVELERRVEQKTEALTEMLQQLESSNQELTYATQTDALTEIGNRRYLDSRFPELIKQCQQHRTALGVLVIDADHFKQINDKYGHLAGDECLKKIATLLRRFSRRDLDVLARFGGEEFVLLLGAADDEGAQSVAESIRSYIEKSQFWFEHSKLPVTVSIGLFVTVPSAQDTAENLLEKADQALYQAKNNGRNRVETYKDSYSAANA